MKRLTLHPEAEEELRTSERFYEEHGGHDLALDFLRRVESGLHRVAADPQRFTHAPKYHRVQKCRLTRFPFSLYYIERTEDVWVIAVAHHRRRPGYWKERVV